MAYGESNSHGPMTSHDPETSGRDPNTLKAKYLLSRKQLILILFSNNR